MKKVLFLIVVWAMCAGWAKAQTALEVVWEKEYPLSDVFHVNFAPDGKSVYCASDHWIAQVNAETGETMWVSDSVGYVMDMDISPDGSYLVTCNYTPGVCVWDTKTNKQIYSFNPENSDNYGASFIAVSPDGKYILLSYYKDNKYCIGVYDYQNKTQIATIPCPFRITCLRYSHDGKTFAAGGYGTVTIDPFTTEERDQVMLYDAVNWKQIGLLEDSIGTGNGYTHIEYSFSDCRLGVARNLPFGVRIYDIATKKLISEQPAITYCANLAFLPDSSNMLYYYFKGGLNYELGLYNGDSKTASYHICGALITSNNQNDNFRLLAAGNGIFMLKPSTVGVEESKIPIVKASYFEKSIYLTYENIESQVLSISIYNIEGKSVYECSIEVNGNGKVKLNAELSNGIYLYSIKTEKGVITDKFEVVK